GGLVTVGGSPGCYCPGSQVNSGTGLPQATDIKQCVTGQAYNAAHPCGSGGLVAVGGSPGCYCPGQLVNSGTGSRAATSMSQCVTAQAYSAAHPSGGGGGGGGGGSQTATAPNGTTIYKQPNGDGSKSNVAGYVDPGGKVTVVSCNGNFCNISAPKSG